MKGRDEAKGPTSEVVRKRMEGVGFAEDEAKACLSVDFGRNRLLGEEVGEVGGNEVGGDGAGDEGGMLADALKEFNVCDRAGYFVVFEGCEELLDGGSTGGSSHNELGYHWIVVGGHFVSSDEAGVDSDIIAGSR